MPVTHGLDLRSVIQGRWSRRPAPCWLLPKLQVAGPLLARPVLRSQCLWMVHVSSVVCTMVVRSVAFLAHPPYSGVCRWN